MKFSIITLFPDVFVPILNSSILKRAQQKGLVEFELINLRQFGEGAHKTVDDRPYGGGAGMVLKASVLATAVLSIINQPSSENSKLRIKTQQPTIILTSASGHKYDQKKARELVKLGHLILIAGHYEGVDQRFIEKYVDEEISIGDYVLTGGEIPILAIIDSVTRLIPGVLEKQEATLNESFENGLLEYPQYTRPEELEGAKVPKILLSGNHAEIEKWRKEKSWEKTQKTRPDLLKNSP